jgi:hypothetical protein
VIPVTPYQFFNNQMHKNPVPSAINQENFIFFNKLLFEFECFPFYGTFLGFHRDENIIPGDDDVDFYIDIKYKNDVISKLEKNGFNIYFSKKINDTIYFIQYRNFIKNQECICDIYFYEDRKKFIIEKSSFGGSIENKISDIKILKSLIFPLQIKTFFEQDVNFPNDPDRLVNFLYGKSWRIPAEKNTDYMIRVFFGKPFLFKGKFQFFIYRILRAIFY